MALEGKRYRPVQHPAVNPGTGAGWGTSTPLPPALCLPGLCGPSSPHAWRIPVHLEPAAHMRRLAERPLWPRGRMGLQKDRAALPNRELDCLSARPRVEMQAPGLGEVACGCVLMTSL